MSTPFPIINPVLALVGPTAIGKTDLSLDLAEKFNCEIVSLDSMQVYRYLDIGTAKVSREERRKVVHHLIDIVDPDQPYDANRYVQDALSVIGKIHQLRKIPLLTGGTGLYLRALTEGLFDCGTGFPKLRSQLRKRLAEEGPSKLHEELSVVDESMAKKVHMNDTHRLLRALEIFHGTGKSWSEHIATQKKEGDERFTNILQLGLTCDRSRLYERINTRTSLMLECGLKEEVQGLLTMGYGRELKPLQSIGYKHMIEHILDGRSLLDIEVELARDTRRYAKRQFTWFKKMKIEWFNVSNGEQIERRIKEFLASER